VAHKEVHRPVVPDIGVDILRGHFRLRPEEIQKTAAEVDKLAAEKGLPKDVLDRMSVRTLGREATASRPRILFFGGVDEASVLKQFLQMRGLPSDVIPNVNHRVVRDGIIVEENPQKDGQVEAQLLPNKLALLKRMDAEGITYAAVRQELSEKG
jgi:hypothetical protein